MRKTVRTGFWFFGMAVLVMLVAALYWQAALPDEYTVTRGSSLSLPGNITAVYGGESAAARSGETMTEAELRLPLGVAVKTVRVRYAQRETVLVSGRPFGIKMFTEGLMVVGFTDFSTDGRRMNPARSAGLSTGDILLSIDGISLTSNEQMGALVQGGGGRPVRLVYQRQGREYTAVITPQKSVTDNRWHLGLWVRDSSAGIGTVTYFDENARTFSGLGHPICDVDTGEIMTLSTGEGVDALLAAIEKALGKGKHRVRLCIPYSDGAVLDMLHREAQIESTDYAAEGTVVEAVVDDKTCGRVSAYIIDNE